MKNWILMAALACGAGTAHAQAAYEGREIFLHTQVGGSYTNTAPDETPNRIGGFNVYATASTREFFGLQLEINDNSVSRPNHYGENTFLLGPHFYHQVAHRYQFYGNVLGGIGRTNIDHNTIVAQGVTGHNYGVIAFAAGLDIELAHHINIRPIQWEYQYWPRFYDNTQPAHSYDQQGSALNPTQFSAGAAYRF